MFKNLILLLILTILSINATINEDIVSIRLKSGQINGKLETRFDGKPLHVFRGIPYAQPPIGNLRFRLPVPLKNFSSVNAFHFQSSCAQNASLFEVENYLVNKNISEDCLYLNIWSPASENSSALKPVMVWIHGGGFLVGGASEEYYQGDVLSAKGDVVVVTLNYRVNTLGFIYTGRDDAPGNMGLWDQTLALEWIKDNIQYFGGDPNLVTIFGESAGGWSVSLHVLSPASRHLFRNAIINSGSYLYKFCDDKPEDHKRKWLKGAGLIGCNPNHEQEFTDQVMECLREADPLKLASIVDKEELIPGSVKVFEFVVTDGKFLPRKPIDMLRNGDFKRNVNMMVSTVEAEGAFLINNFNDRKKFDFQNPKKMTFSESFDELKTISSEMNSLVRIDGKKVSKLYLNGFSDSSDPNLFLKTIAIAVGDYYLSCPTLLFAKEVFKNSQSKAQIFQYYFNSKFSNNFFCSHWMGVCHTNDYFPLFGMPFFAPEEYVDRERDISAQMMKFVTEFAKTGNPGSIGDTKWQKWFEINGNVISPYYEITNYPKNVTNFGIGLKINECDYLWKKHII